MPNAGIKSNGLKPTVGVTSAGEARGAVGELAATDIVRSCAELDKLARAGWRDLLVCSCICRFRIANKFAAIGRLADVDLRE